MKSILITLVIFAISTQLYAKDVFLKQSKKYAKVEKIAWGASMDDVKLAGAATEKSDSTLILTSKIGSAIYGEIIYTLTYFFNEEGLYKLTEKYATGLMPKYRHNVINLGIRRNEFLEELLGNANSIQGNVVNEMGLPVPRVGIKMSDDWRTYDAFWEANQDRTKLPGVKVKLYMSEMYNLYSTTMTLTKE